MIISVALGFFIFTCGLCLLLEVVMSRKFIFNLEFIYHGKLHRGC